MFHRGSFSSHHQAQMHSVALITLLEISVAITNICLELVFFDLSFAPLIKENSHRSLGIRKSGLQRLISVT